MSKRAADRQITQDTLDREEELEDAGQFERASQSELEERVFKKARRTIPPAASSTDQSGAGRGLFSGIRLTGSLTQNGQTTSKPPLVFPALQSSSTTSNPLSGLVFGKVPPSSLTPSSLRPSLTSSLTPSLTSSLTSSLTPSLTSSFAPSLTFSLTPSHPPPITSGTTLAASSTAAVPRPTFLSELRNLNTSVNDWIGKHVRENPYVDLTPIFRDYEKHLRELDCKFQNEDSTTVERGNEGSEVITSSNSSETDVKASETSSQSDTDREMAVERESGEGERVKGGEGGGEGGEVEGESDKPKRTPAADQEEKEALFSVRAKLFFKKASDREFTELGIGQMRVLPGNGEGVKAVMRNDTSLAKVLLNVRVTEAVPITSKNNNIFLVSVPNPPLDRKAVPEREESSGPSTVTYLIRVKTATLATQLLQALQASSSSSTDV